MNIKTKNDIRRPRFLYIGPPKSGSTWLFEALRTHPEIHIPISKDIYFFDRYFARGEAWYLNQFKNVKQGQICGEISHDYMYSPKAVKRIKLMLPDVKLITILRNPYKRAVSHYKFSLRNGADFRSFSEGLVRRPTIIEHGLYGKYLSNWFEEFEPNQMHIALFEELRKNSQGLLNETLDFLDVSNEHIPEVGKTNPASAPRSKIVARTAHEVSKLIRDLGMGQLLGVIKQSFVKKLIYKTDDISTVDVTQSDFDMMQHNFLPDIERTEKLTGINLSEWKNMTLEDF